MKKIIFVILIIFTLNMSVKADYDCYYKATKDMWGIEIDKVDSFKVLEEEKKFETKTILGLEFTPIIVDSKINSKYTDEYLITNYFKGCCPKEFYVCQGSFGVPGGTQKIAYLIILNGSLYSEIPWNETLAGPVANLAGYGVNQNDCMIAKIDTEKTTVCTDNIEFPCEKYDKLKSALESSYCDPNADDCDLTSLQEYNKKKEMLKSYCSSVLAYGDYDLNPCVNKCIGLQDFINKLENKESSNGECGLSQRLISWILNIMRWIKYIIPVAVIVLGILDFIKAIGADKDDEMKKAQGRFVKRLIAAALIFLVPLIIEFVLSKIGFGKYIDGCGIIDL